MYGAAAVSLSSTLQEAFCNHTSPGTQKLWFPGGNIPSTSTYTTVNNKPVEIITGTSSGLEDNNSY